MLKPIYNLGILECKQGIISRHNLSIRNPKVYSSIVFSKEQERIDDILNRRLRRHCVPVEPSRNTRQSVVEGDNESLSVYLEDPNRFVKNLITYIHTMIYSCLNLSINIKDIHCLYKDLLIRLLISSVIKTDDSEDPRSQVSSDKSVVNEAVTFISSSGVNLFPEII